MTPGFFIDDTVTFTFEDKEYTGVIQGIKQGTGKINGESEPLNWVWIGDDGKWARESRITQVLN